MVIREAFGVNSRDTAHRDLNMRESNNGIIRESPTLDELVIAYMIQMAQRCSVN